MRTFMLCLLMVSAGSAQVDLAVKAARAHLGTGDVVEQAVILIDHGKIAAVGSDLAIPAGVRVLDLGTAEVIPGMVDGLAYDGLTRGASENEETSEVTPGYATCLALDAGAPELQQRLRQGVTTLALNPGSRNVIGGQSSVVKPRGENLRTCLVKEVAGLRVTLGTAPASGNRPPGFGGITLFTRRPNSRMGTIFEVRQAFLRARRYQKARAADPSLPENPELEPLVQALEGKVPVHWQARTAKDIRAALEVAQEFDIPRNVILEGLEADEAAQELKARGVPVLLGPLFHPQAQRGRRRYPEATEPDHLHVPEHPREAERRERLEEAGIEFPLSPEEEDLFVAAFDCCAASALMPQEEEEDLPPSFTATDLWKKGVECAFAAGRREAGDTLLDFARFAVRGGLPAGHALGMVTLIPARVLGVADRVGSLEAGKDADLVVFDGDPLVPTSGVRLVMLEGQVVWEAGAQRAIRE